MKKWIALLFIVALAGTFLPAVLPLSNQKVVLFATTEEEHPDAKKDLKVKDIATAPWDEIFQYLTCRHRCSGFPNIFVLLSDDPFLDHHTPPPDACC